MHSRIGWLNTRGSVKCASVRNAVPPVPSTRRSATDRVEEHETGPDQRPRLAPVKRAPARSLINVSMADFLRRLSMAAGGEGARRAAAQEYTLAGVEELAAEHAHSESSRKVQAA